MASPSEYDYVAVGHVTADIMPDGERRAGGTVLYAALQAARLGLRSLILTRGVRREIAELMAPYAGEVQVQVQEAPATTTLQTSASDGERRQRVLAWAGEMTPAPLPAARIVHLAPVAAELRGPVRAGAAFVGMTPQGLCRAWPGGAGEILTVPPPGQARTLARGCQALVLSEHERAACGDLIAATLAGGGVVAVTAAHQPTELLTPAGVVAAPVAEVQEPVDDLGAGDVYACVFFVELAGGAQPAPAAGRAAAAAALRMLGRGPGAIAGAAAIAARADATATG